MPLLSAPYAAEIRDALDGSLVPLQLREGLMAYLEDGRPTGAFLQAVLSNDLTNAALRADRDSFPVLGGIVQWLIHHAPSNAWGSPARYAARVDAWRTTQLQTTTTTTEGGASRADD